MQSICMLLLHCGMSKRLRLKSSVQDWNLPAVVNIHRVQGPASQSASAKADGTAPRQTPTATAANTAVLPDTRLKL